MQADFPLFGDNIFRFGLTDAHQAFFRALPGAGAGKSHRQGVRQCHFFFMEQAEEDFLRRGLQQFPRAQGVGQAG